MSDQIAAPPPLIVTLTLDPQSQAFFDARRVAHFPPERLFVGAHVTLFHALPAQIERAVLAELALACGGMQPLPLRVTGLRSLGRGVAYVLASAEAMTLRSRLRAALSEWLTPQDRAAWSPHVTVQNKVTPEVARVTLATLQRQAWPNEVTALGLALWRYRGGPWEPVTALAFASA